jgi:hypothetical protein
MRLRQQSRKWAVPFLTVFCPIVAIITLCYTLAIHVLCSAANAIMSETTSSSDSQKHVTINQNSQFFAVSDGRCCWRSLHRRAIASLGTMNSCGSVKNKAAGVYARLAGGKREHLEHLEYYLTSRRPDPSLGRQESPVSVESLWPELEDDSHLQKWLSSGIK